MKIVNKSLWGNDIFLNNRKCTTKPKCQTQGPQALILCGPQLRLGFKFRPKFDNKTKWIMSFLNHKMFKQTVQMTNQKWTTKHSPVKFVLFGHHVDYSTAASTLGAVS